MSAAVLTAKQTQSCPAWGGHEADDEGEGGLHISEVSEVGEVLVHLSQYHGDQAPKVGVTGLHQELYFTVDEAQRIGSRGGGGVFGEELAEGDHAVLRSVGRRRSCVACVQSPLVWLVQDGVPLYDVQALLGHEDYATTQRYAHLAPDAHSKVLESWARRPDARLTHETRKAHPS